MRCATAHVVQELGPDAHVVQELGPILGLEARNIKQEDGTRANLERVFQAMDGDNSKGITKVHSFAQSSFVWFSCLFITFAGGVAGLL